MFQENEHKNNFYVLRSAKHKHQYINGERTTMTGILYRNLTYQMSDTNREN
jgi:hypothetical protein